jgi:tetratricopeptide (TPR) repeat protein
VRYLAGDRTPTRVPLHNLAQCYLCLGRHADALRVSRLALLSAIDTEDAAALAQTLNHLHRAKRELGLDSAAQLRRYLAVSLRLAVRCGHLGAEADSHNELGILLRQEGAYAEAAGEHEAALDTIRRAVDRLHGAGYLNDLAVTRRLAGDPAGALELHRQALAGVEGRGMRYVEARARAGLAECLTETDPDQAGHLWRAALAAFREMGTPEGFELERRFGGGTDHLQAGAGRGTMVR